MGLEHKMTVEVLAESDAPEPGVAPSREQPKKRQSTPAAGGVHPEPA